MLDTLPSIHHDQRSMVTGRSASVMSNGTAHGGDGQKLKSIKFCYGVEVLHCFQRVLRHIDDNIIGSAGPIKIDNAGRFYKPSRSEIQIVKFPIIYSDLLSMRSRKYTDPEIYVRKKIAECAKHEPEEIPSRKPSASEETANKRSRKMSVVKLIDREPTGTSMNAGHLATIFELTHAQTPRNRTRKRPKAKLLTAR